MQAGSGSNHIDGTAAHRNERAGRHLLACLCGLLLWLPASGYPSTPVVDVCLDYHCDAIANAVLSTDEWLEIRRAFAEVGSAESEREAIARAIGQMERFVGDKVGTAGDAPKNEADSGERGQLDCIAESTNSETYLRLFDRQGLLKAHDVEQRVKRTRWLFAVHWTAVIRDRASGQRFAVDSWYRGNGEPAIVQPLEEWRQALNEPVTK